MTSGLASLHYLAEHSKLARAALDENPMSSIFVDMPADSLFPWLDLPPMVDDTLQPPNREEDLWAELLQLSGEPRVGDVVLEWDSH